MAERLIRMAAESATDPNGFLGSVKQRWSILTLLAAMFVWQANRMAEVDARNAAAYERTVQILSGQVLDNTRAYERAVNGHQKAIDVLEKMDKRLDEAFPRTAAKRDKERDSHP